MTANEDLLRPSLAAPGAQQKSIYSTTAGYLTAFFGGPFAAIAMAGVNSWRLGRLAQDALVLVAALAIAIGLYYLLLRPEMVGFPAFEDGARGVRYGVRILGLLFFGAFWLLHRRYYRGMELLGLKPPNPWIGGVICIAFGVAVSVPVIHWLSP